ncbi:hypothetical protein BWQ96_09891 [Gracilariopsis chorda]|uniref:EF-hand domain-containing protein n=1 Tax=Gracilariopsis chorda TaxID=448386 RepID=A0A2V3IE79_9FLOR|nr:hypothetical protein BWQ96_09891 [Gracilariopsis chorda]|eukprot:PXF40399.1 hypothetical protein BWQ96_09891 [Gracilariopsis chorda]
MVVETLDLRTVFLHCQNAAYAAGKLIRQKTAYGYQRTSHAGAEDVVERVEDYKTLSRNVESMVAAFLREKCHGLNIHTNAAECWGDDQSLSSNELSSAEELSFQLHVPDHFRNVSRNELEVVIEAVPTPCGTGSDEEWRIIIGILIAQRSVGGIISRAHANKLPIVALVDSGVQNLDIATDSSEQREAPVLIASDSEDGFDVRNAMKHVGQFATIERSSFVEDIIRISRGAVDLCILRDTGPVSYPAALEATVVASGGHVTNVFGTKFVYTKDQKFDAKYGFVASSKEFGGSEGSRKHMQLCQWWREAMVFDGLLKGTGIEQNAGAQATDVAVDLDGNVITREWLSAVMGKEVESFTAPESSAVRYLMSYACRVAFKYKASGCEPQSVFLKRVVMDELEHVRYKMKTAAHKLIRDVCSYKVEGGFLNTGASKCFGTERTRIVRPYYIECRAAGKDVPAMYSGFLCMLEDFASRDGWYQTGKLKMDETMSALDALASFHAFFWNARYMDGYEELNKSVWQQATYWLPSRQAGDSFEKIERCWKEHRRNFGKAFDAIEFDEDGVVNAENFGAVLERFARGSAEIVHGYGTHEEHCERTLIHGDSKAANLFFKRVKEGGGENGNGVELKVGLIDFQWCGWGHCSVDVAYLMLCATEAEVIGADEGSEDELLQAYYERFVRYLVRFGKAGDEERARCRMKYAEFKRVYEEAVVDIARVVVSYHWVRITASEGVLRRNANRLGANTYNKDLGCAKWLIEKTGRVLARKVRAGAE